MPIDELALIRSQLRELERREKVLREIILGDETLWVGTRYCAEVRRSIRHWTDVQGLRQAHPDIANEFTTETEMVVLKILERERS